MLPTVQVCLFTVTYDRLIQIRPWLITIYSEKNRLVDSCSKWDASNPEWKFPLRCARTISTAFFRKIGSEATQAKRPDSSKNWQMERTFCIRKLRLGILVYLSRNPVFPRKFPFGEAKFIFPITFEIRNFQILGVNAKQPLLPR